MVQWYDVAIVYYWDDTQHILKMVLNSLLILQWSNSLTSLKNPSAGDLTTISHPRAELIRHVLLARLTPSHRVWSHR